MIGHGKEDSKAGILSLLQKANAEDVSFESPCGGQFIFQIKNMVVLRVNQGLYLKYTSMSSTFMLLQHNT